MKNLKFTRKDFDKIFANDRVCLDKLFKIKYKNTKNCVKCNRKFKYYKLTNRKLYSCQFCGNNISPISNTIFHKSSTSLKNWFYAIYLFSVSKNGVSGKEIERHLGTSYKTAWRMANRIRLLFQDEDDLLENIIELDETYFGAKETNKHFHKHIKNAQGRSLKTKTAIIGAVQRNSNLKAQIIKNTKINTINYFLRNNIKVNSIINTDEYKSYKNIRKQGYFHNVVNHSKKEYVKGISHTNTIEGFWSQLKRSVNGTYHHISNKYLQSYINEFAFRYNLRASKTPIFFSIFDRIV